MSKSKLQSAITAINNRYAKGLNDDDQVIRMLAIDKQTKGFSFIVKGDEYALCTDYEKLKSYADKYGYWSDEVKRFNSVLIEKGTILHSNKINEQYLEYCKRNSPTRKQN